MSRVVSTAGAGRRTMSVATIVARRARRVFRLWGAAGPSRQLTTRRARRGATCRPPPAYAGPAQACGLGPVSSVDPPFCSPNARARRPVRARWPHPSFAFLACSPCCSRAAWRAVRPPVDKVPQGTKGHGASGAPHGPRSACVGARPYAGARRTVQTNRTNIPYHTAPVPDPPASSPSCWVGIGHGTETLRFGHVRTRIFYKKVRLWKTLTRPEPDCAGQGVRAARVAPCSHARRTGARGERRPPAKSVLARRRRGLAIPSRKRAVENTLAPQLWQRLWQQRARVSEPAEDRRAGVYAARRCRPTVPAPRARPPCIAGGGSSGAGSRGGRAGRAQRRAPAPHSAGAGLRAPRRRAWAHRWGCARLEAGAPSERLSASRHLDWASSCA